MTMLDSATKIAHEYPIIIHSSEFVAKIAQEQLLANKPASLRGLEMQEDSLSDSSSSENDSPNTSSRRVSDKI